MHRTITTAICSTMLVAAPALAADAVWFGTGSTPGNGGAIDDLSAEAVFSKQGNNLVITLTNDSGDDVTVPSGLLNAVFFDLMPGSLSLTPVSAVLGPTSQVFFETDDTVNPGDSVGGEWAYAEGLTGAPQDARYGISSAGYDLFGPNDRFNTAEDLDSPASPNGLNYGLLSAGDNPAVGNAPVTGGEPLVRNQVVFTLSGLPDDFDPMTDVKNVVFQYGTTIDEQPTIPGVPAPGTGSLLWLAGIAATRRRR